MSSSGTNPTPLSRSTSRDPTSPSTRYATFVALYHVMHGIADHILHAPHDRKRLLDEVTRICRALLEP
jgi:hypothetical protein